MTALRATLKRTTRGEMQEGVHKLLQDCRTYAWTVLGPGRQVLLSHAHSFTT